MKTVCFVAAIVSCCSGGAFENWDRFEKAVRDQQITKPQAHEQFAALVKELFAGTESLTFLRSRRWCFPVVGYTVADVGKGGFLPAIRYGSSPIKGYDFFDGNLHGGHPAYDIFIHDNNRDNVDDRTGRPVSVAAPEDLVVLSLDTGWEQGSALRGGNYLWGLSAPDSLLFYFAHLDRIAVKPGDFCKAGTVLGTIGRTGANAAAQRSPTHLHLMVLKIGNGRLFPVDIWNRLNVHIVINDD